MAFLGDFGKIFLGGSSTGEVARSTASALGVTNQGTLDVIEKSAQGASEFVSGQSVGDNNVDVSPRPAGVDSPATLSNVSQTSGFNQANMLGSGSGFNEGFLGGFGLPGLVQGAGRLLTKPSAGGAITGLIGGVIADFFLDEMGNQKKLVITRKLQRDIKKIFMMTGGDPRTTSDIYRSATGRFIPEDKILKILLKTFKNQGPYVTKAAVRKTRSTIRKMETLCDLKDRLCPPKPARRRPAARRMSTSITQVK